MYTVENFVLSEIFLKHVRSESRSQMISSLTGLRAIKKTIYDPHYQRNYVWNQQKASFFIESILIGSEVPPLIMCRTEHGDSSGIKEIIDGRQRFETINRFMSDEFRLLASGLNVARELAGFCYSDLDENVKERIKSYQLRVDTFVIDNSEMTNDVTDIIKKEIFSRYNSGMTKLSRAEVNNAKYNDLDLTGYINLVLSKRKDLDEVLLTIAPSTINDMEATKMVMARDRLNAMAVNSFLDFGSIIDIKPHVFDSMLKYINDSLDYQQIYGDLIDIVGWVADLRDELFINSQVPVKKIMTTRLIIFLMMCNNYIRSESSNYNILSKQVRGNLNDIKSDLIEFTSKSDYLFFGASPIYERSLLRSQFQDTAEFFIDKLGVNLLQGSVADFDIDTEKTGGNTGCDYLKYSPPNPTSMTIEDLIQSIGEKNLIIRPSYQRGERVSVRRASSIIESIVLNLPIPTIFIYKKNNGVSEVIDGQQRILSIIGYLGGQYRNARGEQESPRISGFRLKGLSILTEFEGMDFDEMSSQDSNFVDNILDYTINVVFIDEKIYPNFNPIDLFVRLNDKPYAIKIDSFEMWNAKAPMETSKLYKDMVRDYPWFFMENKAGNKRMKSEELIADLSCSLYFYKYKGDLGINFYSKNNQINMRRRRKHKDFSLRFYYWL